MAAGDHAQLQTSSYCHVFCVQVDICDLLAAFAPEGELARLEPLVNEACSQLGEAFRQTLLKRVLPEAFKVLSARNGAHGGGPQTPAPPSFGYGFAGAQGGRVPGSGPQQAYALQQAQQHHQQQHYNGQSQPHGSFAHQHQEPTASLYGTYNGMQLPQQPGGAAAAAHAQQQLLLALGQQRATHLLDNDLLALDLAPGTGQPLRPDQGPPRGVASAAAAQLLGAAGPGGGSGLAGNPGRAANGAAAGLGLQPPLAYAGLGGESRFAFASHDDPATATGLAALRRSLGAGSERAASEPSDASEAFLLGGQLAAACGAEPAAARTSRDGAAASGRSSAGGGVGLPLAALRPGSSLDPGLSGPPVALSRLGAGHALLPGAAAADSHGGAAGGHAGSSSGGAGGGGGLDGLEAPVQLFGGAPGPAAPPAHLLAFAGLDAHGLALSQHYHAHPHHPQQQQQHLDAARLAAAGLEPAAAPAYGLPSAPAPTPQLRSASISSTGSAGHGSYGASPGGAPHALPGAPPPPAGQALLGPSPHGPGLLPAARSSRSGAASLGSAALDSRSSSFSAGGATPPLAHAAPGLGLGAPHGPPGSRLGGPGLRPSPPASEASGPASAASSVSGTHAHAGAGGGAAAAQGSRPGGGPVSMAAKLQGVRRH